MLRVGKYTVFPYKLRRKVFFAVMQGRTTIKDGFLSPESASKWIHGVLL